MNLDLCLSPWSIAQGLVAPAQISDTCAGFLWSPPSEATPSLRFYAFYFLITCALEFPVYAWAGRRRYQFGSLVRQDLVLNLATHPLIFFVFPLIFVHFEISQIYGTLISEVFAPLTEISILIFIFRYPARRAILFGILANLFSWWAGLYIGPWIIS